jgi:hypothetical protein
LNESDSACQVHCQTPENAEERSHFWSKSISTSCHMWSANRFEFLLGEKGEPDSRQPQRHPGSLQSDRSRRIRALSCELSPPRPSQLSCPPRRPLHQRWHITLRLLPNRPNPFVSRLSYFSLHHSSLPTPHVSGRLGRRPPQPATAMLAGGQASRLTSPARFTSCRTQAARKGRTSMAATHAATGWYRVGLLSSTVLLFPDPSLASRNVRYRR